MSSRPTLGVLTSAVVAGVRSQLVTVEVSRDDGIPSLSIVGLPGAAVRESVDRILAACRQSEVALQPRRTTVNLAPADHPKAGSGLDLPIALGMLVADEALPPERLSECVCLGELQLDGAVRGVPGVLPAALAAQGAGIRRLLVPRDNAAEAAAVDDVEVVGIGSLGEAMGWARNEFDPLPVAPPPPEATPCAVDLRDVGGQAIARRGLEIAAAGGHHLLLIGPPGAGKTLLARALPGLLPPLSRGESLASSAVFSAAGLLTGHGLLRQRPFRAPHHTTTAAGLVGGGVPTRPGEISLAHHGVLFLDELPEFRRTVLECLRQPLEEARVLLVRGGRSVSMPCCFQLVAAMNPCPCGRGHDADTCRCSIGEVRRYWRRLSGPLLDRIDLVVGVAPVDLHEIITEKIRGESSAAVRARVVAAREAQRRRWAQLAPGSDVAVRTNAALPAKLLQTACRLSAAQRKRARRHATELGVSARGWHRVLRVARTLADLSCRRDIGDEDLAEAFQYRQGGDELAGAGMGDPPRAGSVVG